MIIAIGFNAERRREVLGLEIGISEAGLMWTEFLRKRMRRGLRGVKLVVSDADEGIKAAVSRCSELSGSASGALPTQCPGPFRQERRRVVSAFVSTALRPGSR